MCVEFLVCLKSKYLSYFSARRVFRHAGMDVRLPFYLKIATGDLGKLYGSTTSRPRTAIRLENRYKRFPEEFTGCVVRTSKTSSIYRRNEFFVSYKIDLLLQNNITNFSTNIIIVNVSVYERYLVL